jgi:hypothetical protein
MRADRILYSKRAVSGRLFSFCIPPDEHTCSEYEAGPYEAALYHGANIYFIQMLLIDDGRLSSCANASVKGEGLQLGNTWLSQTIVHFIVELHCPFEEVSAPIKMWRDRELM